MKDSNLRKRIFFKKLQIEYYFFKYKLSILITLILRKIMKQDLIFSIAQIFNASTSDGALKQYEASTYYIAPYQRGYKWASLHPNDPVCLLMKDLLDAAKNASGEYYLQFITTKVSTRNNAKVLEVIDGQQRLTTLTIILSVLEYSLESINPISNGLLSYEVRPKVIEFFNNFIYNNINQIIGKSWKGFLDEHPDYNEQDIFYLFNAVNKISSDISEHLSDKESKLKFKKYLLDNVKLILNNIERNISCEEIFSNLNDNKVELTSSELIKGLILTNTARERKDQERKVSYREILELRAVMGRQWDELAHWANKTDVKAFYFPNSVSVLDDMLMILGMLDNYKKPLERESKNDLFNHFQSQIKKGVKTTSNYFEEFRQLKLILNEWFNDTEIYNCLGYLLFKKGNKKILTKDYISLLKSSKSDIIQKLKLDIIQSLPANVDELEYGSDNEDIHNVLLALSVFADGNRFNFTSFNGKVDTWSLEHIFPQTPEELINPLTTKDIKLIESLGGEKLISFENARDLLLDLGDEFESEVSYESLVKKLKLDSCDLTNDEKKVLFKLIQSDNLNSIGNMALLTKSDNSSNRNGMFDRKRFNIVKRISNGSFVPKHTYDVFSKLISKDMTPELNAWTPIDIEVHKTWVTNKINSLKEIK
jgi:hypothetical protein